METLLQGYQQRLRDAGPMPTREHGLHCLPQLPRTEAQTRPSVRTHEEAAGESERRGWMGFWLWQRGWGRGRGTSQRSGPGGRVTRRATAPSALHSPPQAQSGNRECS